MAEASPEMELYFSEIDKKLGNAYIVGEAARRKGYDPENHVDIPLTKNMAERVEGLISSVAPQIRNSGVTNRIQDLEKKYGFLDWRISLIIAEEVANEKFCKFSSKLEAMEVGIRTGFAYHTVGVVAAPLEGFIELKIKMTRDGKEYLAAKYSGPIRGAGGTAASVSVIIADYIRKKMGYAAYDPDESEIKRYITELEDYHERVTNLQYHASSDEIRHLIKNMPIEVDGDPTEKMQVSNYKDLPRIETNRIRGGVCLVISMIALKAPKLWNELSKWSKDFGLDWDFLEPFLKIQKEKKAAKKISETKKGISPDYTFITDLVAGRPVLTYPLRFGGFRLRYGKSRTSGYSAAAIHPALSILLNKFLATGTQLKMERPGKAAALTFCDSIEGPIVELNSGDVLKVETESLAREIHSQVKRILFMGDILISYGDFFDRAHILVPPGYCEEWYVQDVEKAIVNLFGSIDIDKLSDLLELSKESIHSLLEKKKPDAHTAIVISRELKIPLHPFFTYHWKHLSGDELLLISTSLEKAALRKNDQKIIIPYSAILKDTIASIGIPHINEMNEFLIIEKDDAKVVMALFMLEQKSFAANIVNYIQDNPLANALDILNSLSDIRQRDKSGTFIGARMGRPEKAKMRRLTGDPHVLFPVGDEGGRLRSFQEAIKTGTIKGDFPVYLCKPCQKRTVLSVCPICNIKATKIYSCDVCGEIETPTCKHGPAVTHAKQEIDISKYFTDAIKNLNLNAYPDLIKGVRGTSNKDHIPEHISKGILRAKNEVYVNKDGTTRFDMTELPITHFKPKEIGTSIQKLHELGYNKDIYGRILEDTDQICEIKAQDVILPSSNESLDESAEDVMFRIANFVDDLLVMLYDIDSFYNLKKKEDIVGHLVIGLAPHTSAGIVGRIIGFSKTLGLFAHPMFHAAMRRDTDGDEAGIILLMDALLNFSRAFLPDKRGSRTMDAPLVLTARLVPAEVDDMVFKLDIPWQYPLEFYDAASQYKMPFEVKIEQLGSRIGTERQYEGMGFTHNTSDINMGVTCSAYKTLPSMEEKLKGQMEIAEKIRAVDVEDVARLVIEKHLLKDIKGNLRKFSTQQFRCVKCNEKYRRPPLIGKCIKCGGKIIFTVSEGTILKYLEPTISLAKKYNVPAYLKQSIELTQRRIEGVFGKEKEKQQGLGAWFG